MLPKGDRVLSATKESTHMNQKQVTLGALLSYGAIFFNIVSGLLYTPWMIRMIGDDQYALFTLALSVINLFLLDFGIGSAVSKFLAEYYARGEQEKANRFMGIVYKVFFLISAVIGLCLLVFYFCIDSVYVKLTPTELGTFKHLFIIVGVYSVLTFPCISYNGALMANEQFIAVKACNLGQKVLSVALIVAFLLLGYGVYALVLIHVGTNVAFYLIKYLCIRRGSALRADFSTTDRAMAKRLFGFSVWITVMSLAQRCIFNVMPSIIAALIGSAEITVFTLASALESYVYSFADAINGMFLPKVSRIFAGDNQEKELSLLMSRVGRFHIYTIGLLFIGFLCIGQQFVLLWMGKGYELIYVCALLLIFPSLLSLPQQVANTALLATDVVKEQAFLYVGMAAANLLLSALFIPRFGIPGAAMSICCAYLLQTAAVNVLYWKRLPVNLPQHFKIVYGRWSAVAVLTVLIWRAVERWWRPAGWLGLLEQAVVIGLVYAALTLTIGMRRDEKKHLWEHVRRMLKGK